MKNTMNMRKEPEMLFLQQVVILLISVKTKMYARKEGNCLCVLLEYVLRALSRQGV
jgi:hypothetical protein